MPPAPAPTPDGDSAHGRGRGSRPGPTRSKPAVACEVFGLDRSELGVEWYRFAVCAPGGRGGPRLRSRSRRAPIRRARGGRHRDRARVRSGSTALRCACSMRWATRTRAAHASCRSAAERSRSRPPGSSTAGAATTHWMYTARLAAEYPAVEHRARCAVRRGRSSAHVGGNRGGDRPVTPHRSERPRQRDRQRRRTAHGDTAASRWRTGAVPRPTRPGHPRCARRSRQPSTGSSTTSQHPLTIEQMAAHALMSTRTFMRRFRGATGTTPQRWLVQQRVEPRPPAPRDHRHGGGTRRARNRNGKRREPARALRSHGRHRTDLVPPHLPDLTFGPQAEA